MNTETREQRIAKLEKICSKRVLATLYVQRDEECEKLKKRADKFEIKFRKLKYKNGLPAIRKEPNRGMHFSRRQSK